MDALQAIFTRRSVRHFTAEPVSAADVELLLRAAMNAPSAGNGQPWEFVVIRSRAVLDALTQVHQSVRVIQEAPLIILVCAVMARERKPGRWPLDCSAAAQNMLLAAHAGGLGAVWLGVWPAPERLEGVARVACLPDGVVPVAMIAVGHPAESIPPSDRFDPQRIHNDRW